MPDIPHIVATPLAVASPAADAMRAQADGTIFGVWSGALDAVAHIELINQEIL